MQAMLELIMISAQLQNQICSCSSDAGIKVKRDYGLTMEHHNRALRCTPQILCHAFKVQSNCLGVIISIVLPFYTGISEDIPAQFLPCHALQY